MADKNFNQGQQSHQDWDRNRDKNRLNQENDWSSQNQGGSQNKNMSQEHRDVRYSGDSAQGMNQSNQGLHNRTNYIPDNDDNRGYGNYQDTQFGSSGTQGYRSSGMDYNPGGYHSENRGAFGNAGFGNDNNQDWNRNRDYGNQYGSQGQDNDWNRRQQHQNTGGSWSSDYGWQDRNRDNTNYGNGNNNQRDYGNRSYGGGFGNMSNDYGRSDWDRNRSRYDRDDRNYDRRDNHNNDNWWEKTKDKVSSWFGDDDDRDDRRRREYSGGHKGKGPSDYRRSQDRVREDICDRLTDDDRVDASNIRVQFEDDVVILSGTVSSREEKRRAEDLVESVSGVRNVENRLRVGSGSLASREYTGNTDNVGGIGNESGTTNEIIRNVKNERESGDTLS